MEHGKQEVQPGFNLGSICGTPPADISCRAFFQEMYGKHQSLEAQQAFQTLRREGSQDKGVSSHNTGYRRAMEPKRAYSDFFRLTLSRQTKLSSVITPMRIQKGSG
ncbi:hypothetical protein O181_081318 [Austropuccinia psidii MF-1]|uniref:Uncharacterized protein n=1 Tax=Austropuccinia psidii MF-1 TaxID=1389203 RepID=A0A9Q3FPM6_9BASI|nr:hypothetical protein [Austropuccinia psidii MF-1]